MNNDSAVSSPVQQELKEVEATLPSVTIVFLTYNGMPLVKDVMKAIREQQYNGNYEVLCIDSSSTDGTYELCQSMSDRCVRIKPQEFHHCRTRNFGVSLSTADICVFLSQDALPSDPHWLTNLITPFLDPEVGAVYGRQVAPAHFGAQRKYSMSEVYPATRQVRRFVPGKKKALHEIRFSNANSAIRREILVRYPFPENLLLSEDVAACYRVLQDGMSVIYEPIANVIHGHERSIPEEFRWALDAGISLKRLGILDNPEFTSETWYGIKKMADEFFFFARRFSIVGTTQSVGVYAARWFGVQIGKREKSIPTWLLTKMSPTLRREFERSKSKSD